MMSSEADACASNWTALKYTFVEYPKGDRLGQFLAFVSLAPVSINSGFLTLILFRRDLHTIFFFIGLVMNEAFNWVLKNAIAQPRPSTRPHPLGDYGMPSSHSQYMWFFAIYASCFVFVRLHYINNTVLDYLWKAAIVCLCVVLALFTGWSRYYLQYHTFEQIVCGGLLGCGMAIVWFLVVHFLLSPYFPIIVSWKLSELMLIRDTTLIPNVLWFEYTNARQESRARSRKLVSMKSQ